MEGAVENRPAVTLLQGLPVGFVDAVTLLQGVDVSTVTLLQGLPVGFVVAVTLLQGLPVVSGGTVTLLQGLSSSGQACSEAEPFLSMFVGGEVNLACSAERGDLLTGRLFLGCLLMESIPDAGEFHG